jgi:hypothetical protein
MATRIQNRRGLASEWTAVNPILAPGEQGVELDTGKVKAGNGRNAWNQLPYIDAETEYIDGPVTSVNGRAGDVTVSAADIGLGSVANTPAVPMSSRGAANGVATLNTSLQVPVAQIPEIPRTKLAAAVQASLDKADANVQYQRGGANGVAPLDSNSLLPVANVPEIPRAKLAPSVLNSLERADTNVQYARNVADGVAPLDSSVQLPVANLPAVPKSKLASDVQVTLSHADIVWAWYAANNQQTTVTNTSAPTISGTAEVGQVQTSSTGSWSVTPTSYAYQWKRDGAAISNATSSTYTAVSADANTTLTVTVTASASGYTSGSATSTGRNITETSTGIPVAITNTTAPTISGSSTPGSTLTTTTGTWSENSISYSYQWLRNGSAISGATTATYVLTSTDIGLPVSVRVTASRTGYTSGVATSNSITARTESTKQGTRLTSDTYSGAAVTTMSGQSTDAGLGGVVQNYATSGGQSWVRDGNGHLVPGPTPGTQTLILNTATTDHRAKWAVRSVTSGSLFFDVRRFSTTVTGDYFSLQLNPTTGTAYLINRTSGNSPSTTTVGVAIPVTLSEPHTYEVEVKGTTLRWWLDDALVDTVETSLTPTGNFVGVRMTSASIFDIDSVEVFTGV